MSNVQNGGRSGKRTVQTREALVKLNKTQVSITIGLPTWVQSPADHPWHDDEDHRQHFEVAGEDGSGLGMAQVLGRQRPLYNDLIK